MTLKVTDRILKYKDPTNEIEDMWHVKKQVIPVITGVNETTSESFTNISEQHKAKHEIKELQQTVMLGTAQILWKTLVKVR